MSKDLNEDYRYSTAYEAEEFQLCYHKLLVEHGRVQEMFMNECLQKIYHSGRLTGTRLLDFGCGSSVHKVASASSQFNDIVLADWSDASRREVEKWLRRDKDALDWTITMEQCARAEGYRDLEIGVTEIEKRIRGAVKKVVWCDALSKDILPKGIGEFDVINSSRCLEACCITIKSYKEALKKLTKYLKKGGALVMTTVLESRGYEAHKTINALYLTEEVIKESLIEAGLELKDWFCWKESGKYEAFRNGGWSVYYSVKQ